MGIYDRQSYDRHLSEWGWEGEDEGEIVCRKEGEKMGQVSWLPNNRRHFYRSAERGIENILTGNLIEDKRKGNTVNVKSLTVGRREASPEHVIATRCGKKL